MTVIRPSRVAAVALPPLLIGVGCHLVWGDFEVAEGDAPAVPSCTEGLFICDDAGALQQCRGAAWSASRRKPSPRGSMMPIPL